MRQHELNPRTKVEDRRARLCDSSEELGQIGMWCSRFPMTLSEMPQESDGMRLGLNLASRMHEPSAV